MSHKYNLFVFLKSKRKKKRTEIMAETEMCSRRCFGSGKSRLIPRFGDFADRQRQRQRERKIIDRHRSIEGTRELTTALR